MCADHKKKEDFLEHVFELHRRMDLYGALLTERHQECLRLYFREDMGFSEIAEVLSISRQAAHDGVKQAIRHLEEYEAKLHLAEAERKRAELYRQLEAELNKPSSDNARELLAELKQMDD